MELIDQHSKKIMEGCKERARDAGLSFEDETLEYIVTNRDLVELSPKIMIPTLYDYWVHDVEVLKGRGKYELYPSNPYETVINTRPAISFYNDNNPDWLNVMIFYHVLGHIDFFQNNIYFRHTWDYDFTGEALSDKRVIAKLRREHGRWVDYVIEFARGIDNLVGYHREINNIYGHNLPKYSDRINYYFDVFLQSKKHVKTSEFIKEIEHYNECCRRDKGALGEKTFLAEVDRRHPEFSALFEKHRKNSKAPARDLLQFLMEKSAKLNKETNAWMKIILQVVRKTSLFFQPQIRTKIMNEGWASYWHETLFLQDDRIKGHEVDFARVNSAVTAMPRVGLNPYALGMKLFYWLEEMADKGRLAWDYQRIADRNRRRRYDAGTGEGKRFIFDVRENFCDFTFISRFVDQEFIDRNKLFVAGRRLNESKMVWEYYVKSRKAEDYRRMLNDALYHPPHITIDPEKTKNGTLYLVHHFEGKPLLQEFIPNTMLGIEFLWGGTVQLETSEPAANHKFASQLGAGQTVTENGRPKPEIKWRRVLYTMKDRKLAKRPV